MQKAGFLITRLIHPAELRLNNAKFLNTEALFIRLELVDANNGIVFTQIYDKQHDFDFDIVNFPFLDGDVPRRPSYEVNISQLIHFARAFSHVSDFNSRQQILNRQAGYRYHKLRIAFSKLLP